jgi:hypothetical protein
LFIAGSCHAVRPGLVQLVAEVLVDDHGIPPGLGRLLSVL